MIELVEKFVDNLWNISALIRDFLLFRQMQTICMQVDILWMGFSYFNLCVLKIKILAFPVHFLRFVSSHSTVFLMQCASIFKFLSLLWWFKKVEGISNLNWKQKLNFLVRCLGPLTHLTMHGALHANRIGYCWYFSRWKPYYFGWNIYFEVHSHNNRLSNVYMFSHTRCEWWPVKIHAGTRHFSCKMLLT